MRSERVVFVFLTFGLISFGAQAALILSDSFAYTNGPLVTATGSPWTHSSGNTTGQVSVISGRVYLNITDTEDVHAPLAASPLNPGAGTTLYASFTVNFTNLPTNKGNFFAEFKPDGTSDLQCRIFSVTNGTRFHLGVANGSDAPSAILTNDLILNSNYTVVVRYVISNATSTLWVNPSAETNLSVTATDLVTNASPIKNFGFREATAMGKLFVDNLLVGTAFSDVVTNAPQPLPPPSVSGTLSLLTYNTHGNGVADWSTNTAQVQAIGRQLNYLNPDIITFNEIPNTNTYQMAEWVNAFLPGYFLATNSGTDGFIRSVIASRYPIARSQKWLDGVSLTTFGYSGNFTRDLFEAEINVPNFSKPLHVFVAHLKATDIVPPSNPQNDADKRAAEAAAVSNYFVTVFLPGTNGSHPYVLSGDLNEDVFRPDINNYISAQPIQKLTSAPTGLHLTTPINPVTGSDLTEPIQGTGILDVRFDYILPCGLLYSNIVTSQVFRTDALYPVPPNLLNDDNRTASDHLPVIVYFSNPYQTPFRLTSISRSNQTVTLNWLAISNRQYRVEASSNLTVWTAFGSNLMATGTNLSFTTNVTRSPHFFRVFRLP